MGSFRRRIVIVHRPGATAGLARAALEDDFHHFRVAVGHEFEQLVNIRGDAVRHPYSLCPSAADQLPSLVGMPLNRIASAVTRATEASEQCTHLLDLAGLAIAAAASQRGRRQYDIEVPDRINGRTQALLQRDGSPLLAWELQDTTITGPAPYAGLSLTHGFARWALDTLAPDEAEAAIVLRRCAMISLGRHKNLDAQRHALPTGHCHVQQPQRATLALRVVGSTLDLSTRAGELCRDDTGWLAFADLPA
jgi:Protein of unknown function (DUF2889)